MSTKSELKLEKTLRDEIQSARNRTEQLRKELAEGGLAWWHFRKPKVNAKELKSKVDLILQHLNLCYEPARSEEVEAKLVECSPTEEGDKT